MRQWRMTCVMAGFFPVLIAIHFIGRIFSASEAPVIWAAVAYGVLFFVYSLRLALTECPRCNGLYHWSWWANPVTQRCLNCGLSLKGARD